MHLTALSASAALLLAGCAQHQTVDPPAPRTVSFRCAGGAMMAVTYSPQRARLVDVDGRVAELEQRPSGSGLKYRGAPGELSGKGEEISWAPATGEPRTCTAAPVVASADATPAPLDGTRWVLDSFQSSDDAQGTVRPPDPSRYTLEFRGDRAAMRLDCNRATATWQASSSGASGGGLTFGPAAMTRAACPPGSLDTKIAADLPRIRSYTLAGEILNLALVADGGFYRWRRAP